MENVITFQQPVYSLNFNEFNPLFKLDMEAFFKWESNLKNSKEQVEDKLKYLNSILDVYSMFYNNDSDEKSFNDIFWNMKFNSLLSVAFTVFLEMPNKLMKDVFEDEKDLNTSKSFLLFCKFLELKNLKKCYYILTKNESYIKEKTLMKFKSTLSSLKLNLDDSNCLIITKEEIDMYSHILIVAQLFFSSDLLYKKLENKMGNFNENSIKSINLVSQIKYVDMFIEEYKNKPNCLKKTINKKINSYNLKHRVEEYLKRKFIQENNYISIEALNLSMIKHGFEKKLDSTFKYSKNEVLSWYYNFNIRSINGLTN